jgi:hypothetical protein
MIRSGQSYSREQFPPNTHVFPTISHVFPSNAHENKGSHTHFEKPAQVPRLPARVPSRELVLVQGTLNRTKQSNDLQIYSRSLVQSIIHHTSSGASKSFKESAVLTQYVGAYPRFAKWARLSNLSHILKISMRWLSKQLNVDAGINITINVPLS